MAVPAKLAIARGCRHGKWFRKQGSLPDADGPPSSFCGVDTEIPAAALTKTPGPAQDVRITTIPAKNPRRIYVNPSLTFRNSPRSILRGSSALEFLLED